MGRIEKKSYERYDFYDGSFRRAPAKPPRAAPQISAPLLVRLPAPCSCVVLIPPSTPCASMGFWGSGLLACGMVFSKALNTTTMKGAVTTNGKTACCRLKRRHGCFTARGRA